MKTLHKYIYIILILLVVLIILFVFLPFYHKHVRATQTFTFVRDIASFSEVHDRLPSNIHEFCQWKLTEEGEMVWDEETTKEWIRFLWTSPDYSVLNENRLIEVLDEERKQHEEYMNQQLRGRISSNLIMQSINK